MTIKENILEKNGYRLHLLNTKKYKTNTIVWKMKAPIRKEEATLRALLPYVLQSGTKSYPTASQLRSYLDDLYGANFQVDLQKKGEYHLISLTLEIANEKFLSDSLPILEKGLAFLAEVLLHPKTDGESFDKNIVEREKRALKQRIQAIYDDKMRYASLRLIEEMCKDEPYSVPVNGYLEDVEQISAESLYSYYQKSLNEDELDLYIVGDFNEMEVEKLCQQYFSFRQRPRQSALSKSKHVQKEMKEIIERQEVKQGKLNIGYRTNIYYGDDEYFALQIFNGIFGGFPHSKLFINVREKESLAYYAASRIESHKGLLMVMTGIDPKNYEKAVKIIQEQFEAMKNGDFTDEDLQQTKAVIQNQMLETLDTSRGLVEILYHNIISNQDIRLEQWQKKINQVTKEDILAVAERIYPDTIYFLSGMEA